MQLSKTEPNWSEIESKAYQLHDSIGPFAKEDVQLITAVLKQKWDQYSQLPSYDHKETVRHIRRSEELTIPCIIDDNGQIYLIKKGNTSPIIYKNLNRTVRYGLCLNTMQLTIVKTYRFAIFGTTQIIEWCKSEICHREIKMMQKVKNNSLFVQLNNFCTYNSKKDRLTQKLTIVTEMCNLKDIYRAFLATKLSSKEMPQIIPSLFRILAELDKYKILHRDIKLENLFVDKSEDGNIMIRLGDFGAANTQQDEKSWLVRNNIGIAGTIEHMSPEVLYFNSLIRDNVKLLPTESEQIFEKVCSLSTDVWSMGITLFALIYGPCAFPCKLDELENLTQEKVDAILDACIKTDLWFSKNMSPEAIDTLFDCIRSMLRIDPKERLTGPQLLEKFNTSV